jgi:hypothetical protein
MKILIDECLPRKLKFSFPGHEVQTVPEMGWSGTKNGELLRLMIGVFDIFVTIDGNLPSQQNLLKLGVALVVLKAHNNTLVTLQPLIADVVSALAELQPGDIRVFALPPTPDL